jgi:pilus assembly protein CpaB
MARRVLAILVSVLLALFGTAAVLIYVKQADDRALANASPVTVLIARERVPAGTTGESIKARDLVQPVRMPAGSVPLDEVLTGIPEELDKLVVTSDLQPGQLVLRRMFSQSTRTAGGLAIPEGKVAVSVEASMAEQVAGYVRPGSQVAVYATFHLAADGKTRVVGGGSSGGGERAQGTVVVLSKVEVIAVGPYGEGATTTTPLDGKAERGNAKPAVLVTVAVSPVEAAKLIQVAQGDALYLALLNDSSQVRPGVGVDGQSLFG